MRKVFELRLFHSWQEITYSYLCQGTWMGCRPVCTENIYGFLQALLQTGTLWVWWHYILDTSVNKIDYVKQQYIKCSNKSKWKCHLYLGGSVRKASLFQASGIFSNFFFSGSGIWWSRISCKISLAELYERAGKCVILVGKKTQGILDAFYGRKKSGIRSGFVFYSYFKDSTFTQLQQLKGWQVPK